MAESKEGTSASAKPKEKNSFLDDDIGMDFLSSWKSSSAKDDALDFGFGSISNGKKKFNFENMDMDFNLDSGFEKISSFKVDMPDLDFSSPAKKTAKPKERTEEDSSSGKLEGKQDDFNFSFDFNEGDFPSNAESGSKFGGSSKSVTRELTNDEPVLLTSEKNVNNLSNVRGSLNSDGLHNESKLVGDLGLQDKQMTQGEPDSARSKNNVGEDFHANDVQIGSESVRNSKTLARELTESEPVLLRSEKNVKNHSDSRDGFESDSVQNGSKLVSDVRPQESQDKQGAEGDSVMLGSEKNTREDFKSKDVEIDNKLVGSKSLARELTRTEPVSQRSEKNGKSLSNISEGINAGGLQKGNKTVSNSRPKDKEATAGEPVTLRSEQSSGEGINAGGVQKGKKIVGNSRPKDKEATTGEPVTMRSELSSGELTISEPVSLGSERNGKSSSNISESINSGSLQKGSKTVGSSRPKGKEATTGESVLLRSEGSSGDAFKTNNVQTGNKLVDTKSLSRELNKIEPVSLGSEKNVKSLSIIREGVNADGVQNGSTVVGISRPNDKEAKTGEPVTLRSQQNSGFQVNPSRSTEKTTKSSIQASGNHKSVVSGMESIRNLKNISLEGPKSIKRTPDLSSLKKLRTTFANKDLSNSTIQRQSNSLRNLKQNMKLPGNTTSNIAHAVDGTEKQKLLTPSLKRKKFEDSDAGLLSLKPLKRLSEFPKKISNSDESPVRIVEEEARNHENIVQSKTENILHDHPTSGLEVSQDVDMTELDIPSAMEKDGTVEKAEAYSQELEDICNMLKKKHEEAKELLVRAIVNNNLILMLNHPMLDEKILLVQKFATQLKIQYDP